MTMMVVKWQKKIKIIKINARVPYRRNSPYMTMMVVKRRKELNMGTLRYFSAITPDTP
jgi:hypothetical protein